MTKNKMFERAVKSIENAQSSFNITGRRKITNPERQNYCSDKRNLTVDRKLCKKCYHHKCFIKNVSEGRNKTIFQCTKCKNESFM